MPRRPTGQEYFDDYMPDPMGMNLNSLDKNDDDVTLELLALASLMGTGGIGFGVGANQEKKDEK